MNAAYFDASVVLAILLDEPTAGQARALWKAYPERVSSNLFEAECLVTLRRAAAKAGRKLPAGWLAEKTDFLERRLGEMTIERVDAEVLEVLRAEAKLADCRTMDALHLATALLYRERADDRLVVISFDQRMRETAAKVALPVVPA